MDILEKEIFITKMIYISLQLPVWVYRETDFMISTFFVIFFTVTVLKCNYIKDHFPTMLSPNVFFPIS